MKKRFKYHFILILLVITAGCEPFEEIPLNIVSEEYIWDENDVRGIIAENFLVRIYAQLPEGDNRFSGLPMGCVTDEAVPSDLSNSVWNVIRTGYGPTSTFDDNWKRSYEGIRMANLFLANYERVPWADPNLKRWLPSEARTLRAFFYYELVKRYGGIPLIGDKVYSVTDPELTSLSRNSFKECIDYIVSELDAVKDNLRNDQTAVNLSNGNDPEGGRIRKSVVMAIKASVLLTAASPLFNSTDESEDFTGYSSYDPEKWKLAADAAKAVMDLNLYGLVANPISVFRTKVNKEVIWTRQSGGAGSPDYAYLLSPIGNTVNNRSCEGRVSPTQELVDAFPMKNGKMITDPTSGYNPNNPYLNRDPRLNMTVFYNGSRWLKKDVETFEGGLNKPNNPARYPVQTQTGYYMKKFLNNDSESTTFSSNTTLWIYIRYAEILLNYAEAQNEYSGPNAQVYNAVEQIRQRAGLSPYQLAPGLTKEQMREIIRNERRIEFAFEEKRFFDIRRWKIGESVYNTTLHGMSITKNANNTYSYNKTDVAKPYFTKSMNLLPIYLNEILVNKNIKQNPGYSN